MSWPSDTLTNTHTDAPTDGPDEARAEINSSILMIKSILGEAPAGSLLLTNQDEGTGNGLDADTVDGEHATAFANASHNHSAANITTGTLTVARGGTGAATLANHYTLVGSATSAITAVSPSTSGRVLTSNGTGADPSFKALPSFPTVDVHASDFFNGTRSVFPDANAYHISTGFGTNDFSWGFSGVADTSATCQGYATNTGYMVMYSGPPTTPGAVNISGLAVGSIALSITGVGGSTNVRVWARKNI